MDIVNLIIYIYVFKIFITLIIEVIIKRLNKYKML